MARRLVMSSMEARLYDVILVMSQ